MPVNPAESAIITIPLRQRDEVSAVVLARELLDAGVFVNPVGRAAVPRGLGLHPPEPHARPHARPPRRGGGGDLKVLTDNDQLPDGV